MYLNQMNTCCGIIEMSNIGNDIFRKPEKFDEDFAYRLAEYGAQNGTPPQLVVYSLPQTDQTINFLDYLEKSGWICIVGRRSRYHSGGKDKDLCFMIYDAGYLDSIWDDFMEVYLNDSLLNDDSCDNW